MYKRQVHHRDLALHLDADIRQRTEGAGELPVDIFLENGIDLADQPYFQRAGVLIQAQRGAASLKIPETGFQRTKGDVYKRQGNIFGPLVGAAVFSYLREIFITKFPYAYMRCV